MLNFDYSNVFVKSGQNLSCRMAFADSFCRMQPLAKRSESDDDARVVADQRVPFSVAEPEVFQAEIVIRTGEKERHILIVRNGNQRRIDYDAGTDHQRAVLVTDKEYLLTFKRKEYTERPLTSDLASVDPTLTGHLINARDYSDFEEVGRDGSVIQYKVRVNDGSASEMTVFYDQTIGLPVKQEFYQYRGRSSNASVLVRIARIQDGSR
jgi:hypothetical protein